MLDAKTIEIIKSTVPVLEQYGEAITKRFYGMMFESHPELLNIFNHAHQAQGKQPRALAASVYAAAKYIDNLQVIVPVVKQIAHKHRSLNILPEHYPIVGKHLLLAIKDVLGDAATDEIIEAWGKAYGVIADVFINVEKEMYEEAEQQKGGWKGFTSFKVVNKMKESDVITSFYLRPADGGTLASFIPGQYITVQVKVPGNEYLHNRQYSLSDSPDKDYYRISVKREEGSPNGIVSNYLHDQVEEGMEVLVTAPAGDFVLADTEQPVVLISGGVGITPMLSMLNHLVATSSKQPITFIHAARHSGVHAMAEHVKEIAKQHENVKQYVVYDAPKAGDQFDREGVIDLEWLQSVVQNHNRAAFYFCGPEGFMRNIFQALTTWGVPREQIHYEFFGPAGNIEN